MEVSARGNSRCKCTAVKKTKVLQGGTKGAVMVASKGASKRGYAWIESHPTLRGIGS